MKQDMWCDATGLGQDLFSSTHWSSDSHGTKKNTLCLQSGWQYPTLHKAIKTSQATQHSFLAGADCRQAQCNAMQLFCYYYTTLVVQDAQCRHFCFHTNHECSLQIESNLLQFYQTPNLQTAAEHKLAISVNGPMPRLTKRPKPRADSYSVSLQLLNSMNHEASEPWVQRKTVKALVIRTGIYYLHSTVGCDQIAYFCLSLRRPQ